MGKMLRVFRRLRRDTQGAVMVEFAVVCLVFCLIIAGIMDLGHAFYMKQVVTNASREGARYGVRYQTNASGQRLPPSSFSPSIQTHVLSDYLSQTFMPADADPQVAVTGDGYTTGAAGTPLEVTVSATKTWFVLDNFIPTLGSQATMSATTVMLCE